MTREQGDNTPPTHVADMLAHYERILLTRLAEEERESAYFGAFSAGAAGNLAVISAIEQQRKALAVPYPGIRSFRPEEAGFYFMRPGDLENIQGILTAEGMALVIGGSGSGKSSLVQAGLLAKLVESPLCSTRPGANYCADFRPVMRPMDNLWDAIFDQVVAPLTRIVAAKGGHPLQIGKEGLAAARNEFFSLRQDDIYGSATALLDYVNGRFARLEWLARGEEWYPPNLIVLIDQFEESFRKPSDQEHAVQQRTFLTFIDVLGEQLEQATRADCGMFVIATMRSEEMARMGDLAGTARLVNRGAYLVKALDPADRKDELILADAICKPARRAFARFRIPIDRESNDSPFEDGTIDWLLAGARSFQMGSLENKSDMLPLLQHALRAMWDAALLRFRDDAGESGPLVIRKSDLPGQSCNEGIPNAQPDFLKCLNVVADEAAAHARWMLTHAAGIPPPGGLRIEEAPNEQRLLDIAFSLLSQWDRHDNAARNFATVLDIAEAAREEGLPAHLADPERIRRGLVPFQLKGFVLGSRNEPYDISHEALLRNWKQAATWMERNRKCRNALRALAGSEESRTVALMSSKRIGFWSRIDEGQRKIGKLDQTSATAVQQIGGTGAPRRWARLQLPAPHENAKLVAVQNLAARSIAVHQELLSREKRNRRAFWTIPLFVIVIVGFAALAWTELNQFVVLREATDFVQNDPGKPLNTSVETALAGASMADGKTPNQSDKAVAALELVTSWGSRSLAREAQYSVLTNFLGQFFWTPSAARTFEAVHSGMQCWRLNPSHRGLKWIPATTGQVVTPLGYSGYNFDPNAPFAVKTDARTPTLGINGLPALDYLKNRRLCFGIADQILTYDQLGQNIPTLFKVRPVTNEKVMQLEVFQINYRTPQQRGIPPEKNDSVCIKEISEADGGAASLIRYSISKDKKCDHSQSGDGDRYVYYVKHVMLAGNASCSVAKGIYSELEIDEMKFNLPRMLEQPGTPTNELALRSYEMLQIVERNKNSSRRITFIAPPGAREFTYDGERLRFTTGRGVCWQVRIGYDSIRKSAHRAIGINSVDGDRLDGESLNKQLKAMYDAGLNNSHRTPTK